MVHVLKTELLFAKTFDYLGLQIMTASLPSASRLSAAISELEKALSALDQTVYAVNQSLSKTSAPEPHPLPKPEYNPPSSVLLIFAARLTFLLSLNVVAP